MNNEGTFNVEAADGFPFSRDSKDFQAGLALMRKVLGIEEAGHIESLIDNPLFGNEIGYLFPKTWGALHARYRRGEAPEEA